MNYILSDKHKVSTDQKFRTVTTYSSIAKSVSSWLNLHRASLGLDRRYYLSFTLPFPNRAVMFTARKIGNQLHASHISNRKRKVDSVIPDFKNIFRQSKARLNRYERFYTAFKQAFEAACIKQLSTLPFSYVEDGQLVKCELVHVYHVLRQLITSGAEIPRNISKTIAEPNLDESVFTEKYYLVKICNSEELDLSKFWFVELSSMGMIYGKRSLNSVKQESFFKKYGYEPYYFYTAPSSVRLLPNISPLMADVATQFFGAPYMDPHSLRLIFHFAALAVEFFTTTGMRVNELMQLSASPDCLSVIELPGTDGTSSMIKHVAMLIAKGSEEPEPFFFAEKTFDLLSRTMNVLSDINQLISGESGIARVMPHKTNKKAFLMHQNPYVFQLNGKHLSWPELQNMIKFLLHGIILTTRSAKGSPIYLTLSSHIFRHCFATHAVQVENIPIDVVAKLLKHKNLETTSYYSAPTAAMVADTQTAFATSISNFINLDNEFANASRTDQKHYEEIKAKSGSMSKVVGGTCLSHGFCPSMDSCVGCANKIPDPRHRDIIIRQRDQAQIDRDHFKGKGYRAEALRFERLVSACDAELEEMDFQDDDLQDRKIRGNLYFRHTHRRGEYPCRSDPLKSRKETKRESKEPSICCLNL